MPEKRADGKASSRTIDRQRYESGKEWLILCIGVPALKGPHETPYRLTWESGQAGKPAANRGTSAAFANEGLAREAFRAAKDAARRDGWLPTEQRRGGRGPVLLRPAPKPGQVAKRSA